MPEPGLPTQCLARSVVEPVFDDAEVVSGVQGQVRALGQVLPDQAIGVLIRASLPGTGRAREEDPVGEAGREFVMA